jgi:hypothetical protein
MLCVSHPSKLLWIGLADMIVPEGLCYHAGLLLAWRGQRLKRVVLARRIRWRELHLQPQRAQLRPALNCESTAGAFVPVRSSSRTDRNEAPRRS